MCLSSSISFQTFDDGASVLRRCSVEALQSILDPTEAKNSHLRVDSFRRAVRQFCDEGQSDDKIMIVAFEKDSSDPSGLVLLKKRSYEASRLTPFLGHVLPNDMRTTTRKLIWELSYCVRRVDKRSLCLGDILLSCAIEEVRNRARHDSRGASTYIWLVLAGGFSNLPALRLYLAHGFEIIGFHEEETEPLMAVRNVSDENTRRALKQVKFKLESTFLLPVLKNAATTQPPVTRLAPNDVLAPSSTVDIQDSQSTEVSGENLFSQQSSVATGETTAESELQGTSRSSELEIQIARPQENHDSPFSHSGGFAELASSEQSPDILMASPEESQEDQISHSEVSDEAAFSQQLPAATKVQEHLEEAEDDEVSK